MFDETTLQQLRANLLSTLDLSSNRVVFFNSFSLKIIKGTVGVTIICEALKSNTSLTSLDLSCNMLVALLLLTQYR
jgi:hypothetical protein